MVLIHQNLNQLQFLPVCQKVTLIFSLVVAMQMKLNEVNARLEQYEQKNTELSRDNDE